MISNYINFYILDIREIYLLDDFGLFNKPITRKLIIGKVHNF